MDTDVGRYLGRLEMTWYLRNPVDTKGWGSYPWVTRCLTKIFLSGTCLGLFKVTRNHQLRRQGAPV